MHALDCALRESKSWKGEDLILLEPLLRIAEAQRDARPVGTFLEIGAYTGIEFSNTLVLERCFGWRGLLIEANSANFRGLQRSGRVAELRHAAVCAGEGGDGATVNVTRSGGTVAGSVDTMSSGFLQHYRKGDDLTSEAVPCQSLVSMVDQSLIARSGVTFLSLDVEGAEEEVLRHGAPKAALVMVETQGGKPEKNSAVHRLLWLSDMERARGVRVPSSDVYVQPELQPERLRRQRPSVPTAMRLPGARPGHCGETVYNDEGDCAAGGQGSWRLGKRFNVSDCVWRCAHACARCRYVTVSVATRDCSWYARCSLEHLQTAGLDHQSLRSKQRVVK